MNAILIFQTAAAVAALPFGALALAIAHRVRGKASRREGWLLTGWCFLLIGVVGTAQAAFSNAAMAAGPESRLWSLYLDWGAGGNYGRLLPIAVLAAALIALSLRGPRGRALLSAAPLGFGVAMVLGFAIGAVEGPLGTSNHVARVAVVTAATVVMLLGALLLAAATDVMDQLLWLALAAYTLKQAVSVSLFSILAWMAFSTGNRPITLYVMHAAAWAVILLITLRRYQHAVRHREVPALFERVDAIRRQRLLS